MNKQTLAALAIMTLSGCTSMKYNGALTDVQKVDYPEKGEVVTAYIGEHLVEKGTISTTTVLRVHNSIDGVKRDIPAADYAQLGNDKDYYYFSAQGVVAGLLSDPIAGMRVKKNDLSQVCVLTTTAIESCYAGNLTFENKQSEQGNSFQQTLIYSGRVGDKINIGYREFSNDHARPAFNNEVEYDLSNSNVIGYKGAVIEVLKADNSSITYKLVRNFK